MTKELGKKTKNILLSYLNFTTTIKLLWGTFDVHLCFNISWSYPRLFWFHTLTLTFKHRWTSVWSRQWQLGTWVAAIGDRGELIGNQGGCGPSIQATLVAAVQTCIADRGGCGYRRSSANATPVVPIMVLKGDVGNRTLKTLYQNVPSCNHKLTTMY